MTIRPDGPTHGEFLPDEGLGGFNAPDGDDLVELGDVSCPGDEEAGVPFEEPIDDDLPELDLTLPGIDVRERALPVRQGDLTRMLLADPLLSSEERGSFAQFARMLAAMFHSEFFDRLCELKELYASLDPDSDYVPLGEHTLPRQPDSDEQFLSSFEATLFRANYRLLSLDSIKKAIAAPNELGLTYVPNFSLFEHLKVYVRGYTQITRHCRTVRTRFRKARVTLDAYQRMVVAIKFREDVDHGPLVRPDVVYLRMFKDVPHVDMEMHLPEQGTKVRMRWLDKAQIASPLMTGIPTMVAKYLFAASLSPVLVGGLLIAPISAGVSSFFGYQRSKQKHLYEMIHRLYYLTIANNSSVLTRLIDSAEDEEYKEAILAYIFLWKHAGDNSQCWTAAELDRQIEAFLTERTGVAINFEVGDALGKLYRLGLARHDHRGRIFATPIDEALRVLDRNWDATFRFA